MTYRYSTKQIYVQTQLKRRREEVEGNDFLSSNYDEGNKKRLVVSKLGNVTPEETTYRKSLRWEKSLKRIGNKKTSYTVMIKDKR